MKKKEEADNVRELGHMRITNKIVVGLTIFCPFSCIKKLIYRIAGARIGKRVFLGPKAVIISNSYRNILIEDNVFISYGAVITADKIRVGEGTHIGYEALIIGGEIDIGKKCNINNRAFIEATYAPITIEDDVTIAGSVMISSHDGSMKNVLGEEMIAKPIILKQRCFIGNNSVLLPGVTIGKQAIVGAGAVVTKDVPSRTIVAGVPAKELRKI
jgi:acetyltransferase-like isoleucine patch superfamily enzyme